MQLRLNYVLISWLAFFCYGALVKLFEYYDIFECYICKEYDKLDAVYDYIIVGCGTAGSVLALRLSEDKKTSVLVLEAGTHGFRWLDIPAINPLLHSSAVDWKFQTVPQKHAAKAFKNQTFNWPAGRVVGGSSRINNMIYSRGHSEDFQEWYHNLPNYTYESDILHYFKKNEDQIGLYKTNTEYHSTNGPLVVNDLSITTILAQAFLKAVKLLGYYTGDINSPNHIQSGFMETQVNVKSGIRWSVAHNFQNLKRANLKIQTNARVTKIVFKTNNEAYGIKYNYLGENLVVKARKGVILSAGTINTPKILMLSGIGPKDHLSDVGIKPRTNLPVGQNLQDHLLVGLDLVKLNTTLDMKLDNMFSPLAIYDYFFKSSGIWTTVGCEIIGFVSTKNNTKPDLGFEVLPVGISTDGGNHLYKIMNLKDEVWNDYFKSMVDHQVVSLVPVVLHPKSRGTVRLVNKNPQTEVLIDPNYLSNTEDIKVLIEGIRIIQKIVSTVPMRKLGATINNEIFPWCRNVEFDSDAYWECYIRHLATTNFHYAGTCKMGTDVNSVIGYNFKVHNINKLYVVDASVLPSMTSGNINAVVSMLAEKAAEEIKKDNFFKSTSVCPAKESLFIQNHH